MKKEYLGDGVYAEPTEFGEIRLFTSNGIEEKNEIFLDYSVAQDVKDYIERWLKEHKNED